MPTTLPLSPSVAQVTYNLTPPGALRAGFNLGLIIGSSPIISTTTRVVVYPNVDAMITAGFTLSSPEVLAAQLYFSSPAKPTQIAIGRQGTGETPLQALQACRAVNDQWYIVQCLNAVDADHLAIAAYIETATPFAKYFITSGAAAVLNNTSSNLFQQLNAALYSSTLGQYSTQLYASASIMGYAMGATTDFADSAYTLKFKKEIGVTPENLTVQQVANIEGNKGNVYVTRGGLAGFEQGTMFDGTFFDDRIYLDKWANECLLNVADLLYSEPKVAQTEDGVAKIRHVITSACNDMVRIGVLADGGFWEGDQILTLSNGDYLPTGFAVLSLPIAQQNQSDRAARKSPPIYIAGVGAGAIHSVAIQINFEQ